MTRLAVLLAGLMLAGCSPASGPGATSQKDVPWQDYGPGLQSQIDQLAQVRDCSGLQIQFDAADANNAATRTRTGHNNADLMTYIDDKLRGAGCY